MFWGTLRKKRVKVLFGGLVIGVLLLGIPSKLINRHSVKVEFHVNLVSDHAQEDVHLERDAGHKYDDVLNMASIAVANVGNLPPTDFIVKPESGAVPTCARFPDLYSIEFSNSYWQVQNIEDYTFFLYKAYFDHRFRKDKGLAIRILTMANEPSQLTIDLHCQLWYRGQQKPHTVPVGLKVPMWYKKWTLKGKYTGHILTCYDPTFDDAIRPVSVSLVGKPCDHATNNLGIDNDNVRSLITNNEEHLDPPVRKAKFGVCVKALDFLHGDQSLRLVEWIELLHILGVETIFFYEFAMHANMKKVLDFYAKRGMVDVTPLTLPGTLPNEPTLRHLFFSSKIHSSNKRKNEVIPYNDCLYRNLNKFDYLAVLDTDEVIIPKTVDTWHELIAQLETVASVQNSTVNPLITTFCFRNLYFFDSLPSEAERRGIDVIPSHLHMLKHVYRAANYTPPTKFVKCIHSTEKTALVHNHFPLGCLDGQCNIHHAEVDIAHLQHYRSTCVRDLKNCEEYEKNPIVDTTIWKYRQVLTERVNKALSQLELPAT